MSNRTCLKRKMPVNKLKTSSACYVAELIFSGSQSGVTRKVMKYESEAKKIKEIAVTACVCASARMWGVLSKGLKEEREEKKVIDALGKGRRRSGLQLNCWGCNASQLSTGRPAQSEPLNLKWKEANTVKTMRKISPCVRMHKITIGCFEQMNCNWRKEKPECQKGSKIARNYIGRCGCKFDS